MSREVDKRDPHHRRATPAREAELRSATAATSDQLPGRHRIRVTRMDERSGNPATIISEAAPARPGDYIQRALEHVQGISRALGFDATQASEYIPDPNYQTASSGAVAVHMQQQLKGIPIFGATETVRFDPDGRITETTGSSVTLDQNAPLMLQISVREAVLTAARHVAVPDTDEPGETDQFGEPVKLSRVDLSGFEADIIASFPEKPERPTVIEAGPFQDSIKASLLWFPLDDLLRLTWQVLITLPDYQGQYRTLVDTRTGEILYCKQQLQFIAARGNVYRVDGRSARELTDFPLALNDYNLSLPADLPVGFPDDWVESDRTIGNPVNAQLRQHYARHDHTRPASPHRLGKA
jgi:extracellular elastinolytic metalloproteinase